MASQSHPSKFHRLHPACSGVLLNPTDYRAPSTHPACVFNWSHESRLQELVGPASDAESEEYEDYEEDDAIYDEPEQQQVLERILKNTSEASGLGVATCVEATTVTVSAQDVSAVAVAAATAAPSVEGEKCPHCHDSNVKSNEASTLQHLREVPNDLHSAEGCLHGYHVKDLSAFTLTRTVPFLGLHIGVIPADYVSMYTNRMTVLHFSITGLSVLGQLDVALPPGSEARQRIVDWIYGLQIVTPESQLPSQTPVRSGFRASPCFRFPSGATASTPSGSESATAASDATCHDSDCSLEFIWGAEGNPSAEGDEGSLPATYASLCSLLALGDDLSKVQVEPILEWVRSCQILDDTTKGDAEHKSGPEISDIVQQERRRRHGGFASTASEKGDVDVRFTYCAAVIPLILARAPGSAERVKRWCIAQQQIHGRPALSSSSELHSWVFQDLDAAIKFLASCQIRFQGGFALSPSCAEAHGGATYTAVASLAALNALHHIPDRAALEHWILSCQGEGFRGRINKARDCCYSFWTGATIAILGVESYTQPIRNALFNMRCQSAKTGGFGRDPANSAEIMHTFYAILGLSLAQQALKAGCETVEPCELQSTSARHAHSQALEILKSLPLRKVSPIFGAAESIFTYHKV